MDYSFLSKTALFHGISANEIKKILSCLAVRERTYNKNEIIFYAGDTLHEIGLVKSGSVNIVVNLYWGNSHIFGHIEKGDIFGENYAALGDKELICDVVATEKSEILFLDLNKILTSCKKSCDFHNKLIYNLLRILAQKSLGLSRRMMNTAPKSIRDRLVWYLSEQATINGSRSFKIPFNRQELADYLGVDRSALSNELSKMQKENLVKFRKNEFVLNKIIDS